MIGWIEVEDFDLPGLGIADNVSRPPFSARRLPIPNCKQLVGAVYDALACGQESIFIVTRHGKNFRP